MNTATIESKTKNSFWNREMTNNNLGKLFSFEMLMAIVVFVGSLFVFADDQRENTEKLAQHDRQIAEITSKMAESQQTLEVIKNDTIWIKNTQLDMRHSVVKAVDAIANKVDMLRHEVVISPREN